MGGPRLLIIGAGSVGKRHLKNFAQLGCEAAVVDPRADRREEAVRLVPGVDAFANLEEALRGASPPAAAVICSPPSYHVDQTTRLVQQKIPVFLEKPMAMNADSAARLAQAVLAAGVPVLVGYSYRWQAALREFRRRLREGIVGAPRHVRGVMSAHLADWHPWERYQDFFMARRELGGGALLDESHLLDIVLWCFGMPQRVFASVERLSALEINTDDCVDAWLAYEGGLRVWLHLNLFGRPHERSLTVTGEAGTLAWTAEPNAVRWSRAAAGGWEERTFAEERNDMFLGAAREFLGLLRGEGQPTCTAEDGYRAMRVIEAMRASARAGAVVEVA